MSIVKICEKCGPLTQENVYIRKTRRGIDCRACSLEQQKRRRLENPEKFKEHSIKFRHLIRDIEVKSLKCSKCNKEKCVSEFNKHMVNIRYPYCRECRITATRNDKEKHPKRHRIWYNEKYEPIATDKRLKKIFGISLVEYNDMLKKQNNVCGICKNPEKTQKRKNGSFRNMSVDHDHVTGKIRGLLCHYCNVGIGNFRENQESLAAAIEYLNSYS